MENIFNALGTVSPFLAFVAGTALGVAATLALVFWKPRRTANSDPLSALFDGDTLQSQIARVANHSTGTAHARRDAAAIRARIFAHKQATYAQNARGSQSAQGSQGPIPPHRRERYDHKAVLDHIAKVMRAGSELDKQPQHPAQSQSPERPAVARPVMDVGDEGSWEEVLLLPAPTSSSPKKVA